MLQRRLLVHAEKGSWWMEEPGTAQSESLGIVGSWRETGPMMIVAPIVSRQNAAFLWFWPTVVAAVDNSRLPHVNVDVSNCQTHEWAGGGAALTCVRWMCRVC